MNDKEQRERGAGNRKKTFVLQLIRFAIIPQERKIGTGTQPIVESTGQNIARLYGTDRQTLVTKIIAQYTWKNINLYT
jgi:hypothetical protein